jgi:hypothetical protein
MFAQPHIPFSFFKKTIPKVTSGADGDLVVNTGVTFDLAEGSVKQYNSITIHTGGTLRITGNTGAWTEIACRNDCIINGQIIARAGYDGQTAGTGGTYSKTSAFGFGSLSYSITQSAGGTGGMGSGTAAGGAQSTGNGGGGAGASGNVRAGAAGGAGNSNGSTSGSASGGVANSTIGNGASGAGGSTGNAGGGGGGGGGGASSTISNLPGGGGGGYRGHHGKGLLLFIEGNISGSGSVNVGGRNGFNGGTCRATSGGGYPAGAGGGGAGGSGGRLVIRYRAGTLPSLITAGGSGGIKGTGGTGGTNGSAGANGSSSVALI